MRNIALLEWGPASLFYLQPREKIKIRTPWLENGPVMPPFLSTMEEAKVHPMDLCIRYALSAFEDLNSAIKNLRRCFGFPYQEYIGYLNTLTHTHRARREHEALIDRLRRWAIFCNVDAVIWIDYSKSNQPPGSFKMGPRDSRPFSANHMELCTHVPGYGGGDDNDGDESEAVWSDIEEDHHAPATQLSPPTAAAPTAAAAAVPEQPIQASMGPLVSGSSLLLKPVLPLGQRQVPLRRFARRSVSARGPAPTAALNALGTAVSSSAKLPEEVTGGAAREDLDGLSQAGNMRSREAKDSERAALRSMLQEEVIPAHGSIYTRSIAPGPGYYSVPGVASLLEQGPSFGTRPRCHIDDVMLASKELPGPGEYRPKAAFAELPGKMGVFCKAERLIPPAEASRKLPFISALAAKCEGFAMHSPAVFHSVTPEAVVKGRGFQHAPEYSFSRSRRPW